MGRHMGQVPSPTTETSRQGRPWVAPSLITKVYGCLLLETSWGTAWKMTIFRKFGTRIVWVVRASLETERPFDSATSTLIVCSPTDHTWSRSRSSVSGSVHLQASLNCNIQFCCDLIVATNKHL